MVSPSPTTWSSWANHQVVQKPLDLSPSSAHKAAHAFARSILTVPDLYQPPQWSNPRKDGRRRLQVFSHDDWWSDRKALWCPIRGESSLRRPENITPFPLSLSGWFRRRFRHHRLSCRRLRCAAILTYQPIVANWPCLKQDRTRSKPSSIIFLCQLRNIQQWKTLDRDGSMDGSPLKARQIVTGTNVRSQKDAKTWMSWERCVTSMESMSTWADDLI